MRRRSWGRHNPQTAHTQLYASGLPHALLSHSGHEAAASDEVGTCCVVVLVTWVGAHYELPFAQAARLPHAMESPQIAAFHAVAEGHVVAAGQGGVASPLAEFATRISNAPQLRRLYARRRPLRPQMVSPRPGRSASPASSKGRALCGSDAGGTRPSSGSRPASAPSRAACQGGSPCSTSGHRSGNRADHKQRVAPDDDIKAAAGGGPCVGRGLWRVAAHWHQERVGGSWWVGGSRPWGNGCERGTACLGVISGLIHDRLYAWGIPLVPPSSLAMVRRR